MLVPINDYFSRIFHTLEHVVAPDLESDFARSQVFAVIALLGSLGKKIEYKQELIAGEINAGMEIIGAIADVLKGADLDVPAEVLTFMKESKDNKRKVDIKSINKVNDHFRCILDFLFVNKEKIDQATFNEVDAKVRKYVHDISLRDVGFMPAMSFDKILRSGKKESQMLSD